MLSWENRVKMPRNIYAHNLQKSQLFQWKKEKKKKKGNGILEEEEEKGLPEAEEKIEGRHFQLANGHQ